MTTLATTATTTRATTATARLLPERAAAAALAVVLLAAAFLFGSVYLWAAVGLAVCVAALLVLLRPRVAPAGPLRVLDLSLAAILGLVLLQMVPLPIRVVGAISPARAKYVAQVSLQTSAPGFAGLALDSGAAFHAWVALFCIAGAFWASRAIFARGGIRTFSSLLAWGAIAMALVAFAQHASGTPLVYGFWQPRDAGARPLGPFINRNHLGTWSIMAICLCLGYLQWRETGTPRSRSWRGRMARLFDARRMLLQLAVVLLASLVALAASRAALVALACAAGYVALARRRDAGRGSLGIIAALALIAMLGYGDGQQLLLRVDETRATGMAARLAIWRDALPVVRDFPVAGVGAGNFATAMRVYQTTPRTYYHNEAHNQPLQIVVEGGVLLSLPAVVALGALVAAARGRLRRREDPIGWMRTAAAAALIGVTVQSLWETGLTLPANGMFAAVLAGLLVHGSAAGAAPGLEPR